MCDVSSDDDRREPQARGAFPPTITSAILALKSDDDAARSIAWERVARIYGRPIARYLNLRWRLPPTESEDIAQSFFARSLEKGTFGAFDPQKARFRTFLRTCLDRFVLDERRVARAAKRGGGAAQVDVDAIPNLLEAPTEDPEACFEAEWKKHIIERALERLREQLTASKKVEHLRIFERFHLESDEPPAYSAIAEELGISVTDVTNRLSYARRKLRAITLEILQEITASDEEFRSEAKTVLGVDV